MKESDRTVPMLYERNDSYVIEAFRRGEFDYLERMFPLKKTENAYISSS